MGCDKRKKKEEQKERKAFSILERIEWAATWLQAITLREAEQLSVSSNGSNGLRRLLSALTVGSRCPFSILERIEWAATIPGRRRAGHRRYFQYPRTDRMGCDLRKPSVPES